VKPVVRENGHSFSFLYAGIGDMTYRALLPALEPAVAAAWWQRVWAYSSDLNSAAYAQKKWATPAHIFLATALARKIGEIALPQKQAGRTTAPLKKTCWAVVVDDIGHSNRKKRATLLMNATHSRHQSSDDKLIASRVLLPCTPLRAAWNIAR